MKKYDTTETVSELATLQINQITSKSKTKFKIYYFDFNSMTY